MTAKRAYEFAMGSDDGHRMTPLRIPTKLPATAAAMKAIASHPLRNKAEAHVTSATSARRSHRGKSRLGSIIVGHQQTADPTKVSGSKILFRVIAAFSSCHGMRSWVQDLPHGSPEAARGCEFIRVAEGSEDAIPPSDVSIVELVDVELVMDRVMFRAPSRNAGMLWEIWKSEKP
jgi:hypothetical protein